jgi:hypothetical protein
MGDLHLQLPFAMPCMGTKFFSSTRVRGLSRQLPAGGPPGRRAAAVRHGRGHTTHHTPRPRGAPHRFFILGEITDHILRLQLRDETYRGLVMTLNPQSPNGSR